MKRQLVTFYVAYSELTDLQARYLASWERSVTMRSGGVTRFKGTGWEHHGGLTKTEPVFVYQLIFQEDLDWLRSYVKSLGDGLSRELGQERVMVTMHEVEVL